MAGVIDVVSKTFFDRDKVIRAMDRKVHRVLLLSGGFAMRVMRGGMKRRNAISEPGKFPSAHGQAQLKNLIFFGFEGRSGSPGAVIGPTLFVGSRDTAQRTQTMPNLISEGGIARRRFRRGRRRQLVTQRYRPRPFVGLTMPTAIDKFRENMERVNLQ